MKTQLKRNSENRSVFIIISLIILGSIMVFGINQKYSISAYFLILAIVFFKSKDKVFAIALLFIIAFNPWGLFYYKPHNIVFSITKTVGLEFQTFFALLIYIKYKTSKLWRNSVIQDSIKPYYKIYFSYVAFLAIYGTAFGTSLASFKYLVEAAMVLSIFLVMPRIFDYESMLRFNRIVFTFTLVLVAGTIVDMITGGFFLRAIVFNREVSTASTRSDELVRITGGAGLALYSLINSTYYIIKKSVRFNSGFLWVVVMASGLFILNTATRGWIIAAFLFIIASSFYYLGSLMSKVKIIARVFIIVVIVYFILPNRVKNNLNASLNRLSTVEAIAEGDMSAGGTARRWSERGPAALTRFNESPVFGFGFSRITAEYWDHHVGNHTVLLTGGILGLSIIWLTVISISFLTYRQETNLKLKGNLVYGFALGSFMVIHSTNRIMPDFVQFAPWAAFLFAITFSNINANLDYLMRQKILKNNEKVEAVVNKKSGR